MFNLLQTATDDQTALGACLVTLLAASSIVFASFHLGPAGQKLRQRKRDEIGSTFQSAPNFESGRPHERAA
jgi:hypothetical protein